MADRHSKAALYNKLGFDTDPFTIMKRLGLNVPSQSDISTGIKTIAEDFSPAADVKELTTGSEEFSEGNYLSGISKMLGGLAGMAIPFSGKIRSAGKAVGKNIDDKLKVIDEKKEAKEIIKPANIQPTKTKKVYKLFKVNKKDGGLHPLFVKMKGNKPIPQGEWVKAELGAESKTGKVKSSIGDLAWRPGFHSGDLPIATHIGGKIDPKTGKAISDRKFKPNVRKDNQVWAEVEVADDVDWQSIANDRASIIKKGKNKGKLNSKEAHITDQLPFGGNYNYKTSPNMTGNWVISGEMKVNKILSDDEVKAINKKAGVQDLPRKSDLLSKKEGGQIMPMQYGGGLDDAYMNRRRSSAFAAPDATSAFASPMSQGGLPTIYREAGGGLSTIPKERMINNQPHQLSYINPQEAGLLQALGGSGRRVDGIPSYFWGYDEKSESGYATGGEEGFGSSGDLGDGNYFTDPGLRQGQSAVPATAPQGGPSGDVGSDVDTGGYGLSWDHDRNLLGLQRADPNQPNIGFEAYFNTDGKDGSAYDVGMPASPSTLDPIRNLLNKALPKVFDKPSGSAFVVGKDEEVRQGAYNAALRGYTARGLDPAKYDSWFSKNAGNLMEGYQKGGDVFDHHANKVSTDASNKFSSTFESNKTLDSNKGKTDEEIANETLEELFGPDFKKSGSSNYPVWAPGGGLIALVNAIGKATGRIGTVTINGVKMEANRDGTLREEAPLPSEMDLDYGSDAPDEKGTPKTEKDVELVNDLKKKSVMGELLRKEKKKRVDPNIQIIMDIYGLTFEEAQRFLGKESGVGTGGAGEFEGI